MSVKTNMKSIIYTLATLGAFALFMLIGLIIISTYIANVSY